MRLLLLELREILKTSIWFIPGLICLLLICLSILLLWVERGLDPDIPFISDFAMPVASARNMLGVIAGAVLSVGGVVFSVTMVALTLTSGQYGPKILRQFLGDNGSKITLGLFLGTSLYCLITVWAYHIGDQPGITVLAALLLTILAMSGFIRFIHRTATDLQADQIIQRIGGELEESLSSLTTPESLHNRHGKILLWRKQARGTRPTLIASRVDGYVQTVDYPALVSWCEKHNCVGMLQVRAGDFLLQGNCFIRLYGSTTELDDKAVKTLRGYVRTGRLRTALEDPEYPITQLNQLAARALSPGINDPGTAITCIDWYSMAVARIADLEMPGKVFLDSMGEARLLARYTDFAGILKAFYAPSRQFARENIAVLISLANSLIRLAELTTIAERLSEIAEQGHQLCDSANRGHHMDADLKDFNLQYKKLLRVTGRNNSHSIAGLKTDDIISYQADTSPAQEDV